MAGVYPIFVFLKDDNSIELVRDADQLCRFEKIDLDNQEYLFWDATGASLRITAAEEGRFVISASSEERSLSQAFAIFAKRLGISDANLGGTPLEVFERLSASNPPKRNWFGKTRK